MTTTYRTRVNAKCSQYFLRAALFGTLILLSPFQASAELNQVLQSDQLFGGYAIKFDKKIFAHALFNLEVFKIKNSNEDNMSKNAPFYLDMRDTVSNPQIRSMILSGITELINSKGVKFNHICGTPITGKAWAASLSRLYESKLTNPEKTPGSPVLLLQKKKGLTPESPDELTVEGKFNPGESCLLIDDVLASGKTLIHSLLALQKAGIRVDHVIVAIDREEGGSERITHPELSAQLKHTDSPIQFHSLAKLSELLETLHQDKKMNEADINRILNFTKSKRQELTYPKG
jgi:uridine monophosphate synthetase